MMSRPTPPKSLLAFACIGMAMVQTGCLVGRQNPAATQPVTALAPETARPSYWLNQPPVAQITADDFDSLWSACQETVKAAGFLIDRADYRDGLMTTLPLVSKQVYEFWRGDVITAHDLAQSTLGTMRRTVQFSIRKLDDGSYEATPKVLVERNSMIERRITSVDQYQAVFSIRTLDVAREAEQTGTEVQSEYWYSVGRDEALETQLADSARQRAGTHP